MSSAPSVAGSVSSSEWGREYEDEDTWYQFADVYQSGMDTHLLPTADTAMSLRMAQYRRTGARRVDPPARPSMKQRLQMCDVPARPAETFDRLSPVTSGRGRPALWQLKDIADDDDGDGQGNAPVHDGNVVHDGNGGAARKRWVAVRDGSYSRDLVKPEVHVSGVAARGEENLHECGVLCNTFPDVAVHDGDCDVSRGKIIRTESVNMHVPTVFPEAPTHVSHIAVHAIEDDELRQRVRDDITNATGHRNTKQRDLRTLDHSVPGVVDSSHDVNSLDLLTSSTVVENQTSHTTKLKGTVPWEICEEFSGLTDDASPFHKTRASTDQFTFLCLERKRTSHDPFQPHVSCVMYLCEDTTVHDSLAPPPGDTDSGDSKVANGVVPQLLDTPSSGATLWCKTSGVIPEVRRTSGVTPEVRRTSGVTPEVRRAPSLNLCEAKSSPRGKPDVNDNTTPAAPFSLPRAATLPSLSSKLSALVADDVMAKNLKKFPFFAATRRQKSSEEDKPRPPPVETLAVLLRRGNSDCLASLNLTWLERARHGGLGGATVWVGVVFGAAVGVLFAVLVKVLQAVVATGVFVKQ